MSSIIQNVIAILLEDNIALELPLEYRENLVTELRTNSRRMSEDEEITGNVSLDWQVMVCNIIRDVIEGRPTNPGFWLSLGNCYQNQLDVIFSVSDVFFMTQPIKACVGVLV